MLGLSLIDTVIGEGPSPKELGKTICAYTMEHAYQKAAELFREERSKI
ncbi:MAG: hypothetical protein WC231_03695 [Dehalococcoidales bacterium]|nr:hypothetical protein [Dehalococcoidales bacterium]NLE89633.1 hypothetical protein [Dehalococcoidales bacterium]